MNAAARVVPTCVDAPSKAGWEAELDLTLTRRAHGTVLSRHRHRGPLLVQKALYPEGRDTCHVTILHPPGGVAAGDRLKVSVELEPHAAALLTTPGATKWYRSAGEQAYQQVALSVAEGAVLEWLPRENIFFDGAQVMLGLDVNLMAGAHFIGWDLHGFGRRASGETWRRGALKIRTSIHREERLLWSEMARVDAAGAFAESSVGLAGASVCGTLVAAGWAITPDVLMACRDVPAAGATARIGITHLPEILLARYLGDSTEDGFRWFTALWGVLRQALAGKPACEPRVWAC